MDHNHTTPSAAIYDSFLPWALNVANKFGLVGAVFFTQSSAVGSIYYHIYKDKRLQDDEVYGFSIFRPNIDACMKWLNDKPKHSVVYVSFGSLASLEA
ncbi:hypothetical protein QQP08_003366 [Theobroma cacao]|nr:hypothetical protein QQP08_003366 [Theobroma cacao]